MKKFLFAALFACLVAPAHAELSVELDYRTQPNQSQRMTTRSNGTTTMKIDIAANPATSMPAQSTVMSMISESENSALIKNGAVQADGSFTTEMSYDRERGVLRVLGAGAREITQPPKLQGMRVSAVLEKGGKLREGSVQIEGVEPKIQETMRAAMAAAVQALASNPVLKVQQSKTTEHAIDMPMALPSAGTMNVKVRCDMRLIDMVQSLANIAMDCKLGFDLQNAKLPITAVGRGQGTMQYDNAKKMALSSEMTLDMKLKMDAPEFKMDMDMRMQQGTFFEDLSGK